MMVKTQIQIPEHLYRDAKRVAAEYEMSFAEVVRRGLERVLPAYPPRKHSGPWHPPGPRRLRCGPLDAQQLRDLARGEEEFPGWLRPRTHK